MKNQIKTFCLNGLAGLALLAAMTARTADFHCATAQDVQNALTVAAANNANNNIWLTNGYYTGNFNFNSSGGYNLSILAEPGVTNTQITIDGAGTGRDLNLANTGSGSFTVRGITFLRNCGNSSYGALRIAAGGSSYIVIDTCRFLSPTNANGIGTELAAGLNATITNCIFTGSYPGGSGYGINCSGMLGAFNVFNSLFTSNSYGIYLSPGTSGALLVTNSFFTDNYYALYSSSGSQANIYQCAFVGNSLGLSLSGGTTGYPVISVLNNLFSGNNNSAVSLSTILPVSFASNNVVNNSGGPAVAISGSTNNITGNVFSGNSNTAPAGYSTGGALFCVGCSYISGNTFTGNSASAGLGGAVYCSPNGASVFVVTNNLFAQNSAASGGAIYYVGGGYSTALIISDNLIVRNTEITASSAGAGIYINDVASFYLINNTIFGNTAAGNGGGLGITLTGTTELLNVYNNIIWGNSANGNGADVWLAGTGQRKTFLNNDVHNMYGVWDIAQNLQDVDPKFFDAVNGDYHLQTNSPCANFGTNGAPSLPLTDLDGNPRTNSLGQVDLGCYEFNNTAKHPADANGDFVISAAEYAAYAAAWKAGQSWTTAPVGAPNPNPVPANFVTRAGYLMTNGGAYYNNGSARPTNWRLIGQ